MYDKICKKEELGINYGIDSTKQDLEKKKETQILKTEKTKNKEESFGCYHEANQ